MNETIQDRYNIITSGNIVTADVTFVIDVDSVVTYFHEHYIPPEIYMNPEDPYQLRSHVYIASYTPTLGMKVTGSSGALVTVPISSNIRWRATTVSNNFDYSIVLYKFLKLSSGDDIISIPSQIWSQLPIGKTVPVIPSGVNANEVRPKPVFIETGDSYFQATALKKGKERYTWFFAAYDGENLKGYFRFDPYIQVINNS